MKDGAQVSPPPSPPLCLRCEQVKNRQDRKGGGAEAGEETEGEMDCGKVSSICQTERTTGREERFDRQVIAPPPSCDITEVFSCSVIFEIKLY